MNGAATVRTATETAADITIAAMLAARKMAAANGGRAGDSSGAAAASFATAAAGAVIPAIVTEAGTQDRISKSRGGNLIPTAAMIAMKEAITALMIRGRIVCRATVLRGAADRWKAVLKTAEPLTAESIQTVRTEAERTASASPPREIRRFAIPLPATARAGKGLQGTADAARDAAPRADGASRP